MYLNIHSSISNVLLWQVTELQQRLRQSIIEIEDSRAEVEKTKGDISKMERTHARQISDEHAARRSIMAEKDAIVTKVHGISFFFPPFLHWSCRFCTSNHKYWREILVHRVRKFSGRSSEAKSYHGRADKWAGSVQGWRTGVYRRFPSGVSF